MRLVKGGGRAFPAFFLATVAFASIVILRSAAQHRPYALAQVQGGDADERLLFDGAPDAIQNVIGSLGEHSVGSPKLSGPKEISDDAQREYLHSLRHYERKESNMRASHTHATDTAADAVDLAHDPDAPGESFGSEAGVYTGADAAAAHEDERSTEKLIRQIERQNGLSGLGFDPAVVKREMTEDIAHPPLYEQSEERKLAGGSSSARLKKLESKVQVLEGLNARLALGKQPAGPVSSEQAELRAEKVAQTGLKAAASAADALLPDVGGDPAMKHALSVAQRAGQVSKQKAQRDTSRMLHDQGKFKLPKLPGVSKSAWAGILHAVSAGKPDAREIPGIKESTWPFATGSFRAKDTTIPGVNQDSWWVFEPGQSWTKDRQAVLKGNDVPGQGGCLPDATGKLRCGGGKDGVVLARALDQAIGLGDRKERVRHQPGEMQTVVPEIRTDAEAQKLTAASAAFAHEMKGREQLLWQAASQVHATRVRTQELDVVGSQCSTFLDCFRAHTGELVAHHTQPWLARSWDKDVTGMEKEEVAPPMPNLLPDRRVTLGGHDQEYIGRIARPSARSPSGMRHDVFSAFLPSSAHNNMYVHAMRRGQMREQALAQRSAFEMILAENVTNATVVTVSNTTEMQGKVWDGTVCDKAGVNCDSPKAIPFLRTGGSTGGVCDHGVNCDTGFFPFSSSRGSYQDVQWDIAGQGAMSSEYPVWTPLMYTPNKPTSWSPDTKWDPPYGLMEKGTRIALAQGQMMAEMREADKELGMAEADEDTAVDEDALPEGRAVGKLEKMGVNADSGWSPYSNAQIWGYDERGRATPKVPEPKAEEAVEDVHAAEQAAARRRAEEERKALEEQERLMRGRDEEAERQRKAHLLDNAPEEARSRIAEEERRRDAAAQQRARQAAAEKEASQAAQAGRYAAETDHVKKADSTGGDQEGGSAAGDAASDENWGSEARPDRPEEEMIARIEGCDKGICGDKSVENGLASADGMIAPENWGMMDHIERSDGARGVKNLQHALLSLIAHQ